MYPRRFAAETPDRLAIILHGTDQHISYLEMEERANQYAHLFRDRGLKRGDCISIFLENNLDYLVIYWGAQRSGLYITPISSRLTAAEAAYIINDNDSKLLFTSALIGKAAETLIAQRVDLIPNVQEIFALGEALAGATELAAARAKFPGTPIPDESAGRHMVYSSGTTGRPKGIRLPLYEDIEASPLPASRGAILARGGETTWPPPHVIYLSPAPLYHTAPLVATTNQHRAGGTVVILPHFEPEIFLQAVEQHHVTSTQMVPTMFVRLLKLPEDTRLKYDLSSLETVVHAAAPCPVPIKHQMMKWWGPIISEYYGGSEGNGSTWITPEEWIEKPGSV
ncbi:MAG: AMP-binding protein, partial [Caulobacterales bacterium]